MSRVGPPNLDEGPITLLRQAQPTCNQMTGEQRGTQPPARRVLLDSRPPRSHRGCDVQYVEARSDATACGLWP